MILSYYYCLFFLLFLLNFVYILSYQQIYPVDDCSSDSINDYDRALLYLTSPPPTGDESIDSLSFSLYGINEDCKKCSPRFLGNFPSTSDSELSSLCYAIWTPFHWKLFVALNTTSSQLPFPGPSSLTYISYLKVEEDHYEEISNRKSFLFREYGEYNLTFSVSSSLYSSVDAITSDNLFISTIKDGKDSLKPIYNFLYLFLIIFICSFLLPDFVWFWREKNFSKIKSFFNRKFFQCYLFCNEKKYRNDDESLNQSLLNSEINKSSSSPSDTTSSQVKPTIKKSQKERLRSLDTFRGATLLLMIFVNYGGAGYWFFDHSTWDGLTIADCVFPWFVWIMGVSMALSFSYILPGLNTIDSKDDDLKDIISDQSSPSLLKYKKMKNYSKLYYRIFKRSVKLFGLGLFMANGHDYKKWRIPGVLQYFGFAYFVVGCILVLTYEVTTKYYVEVKNNQKNLLYNNFDVDTLYSDKISRDKNMIKKDNNDEESFNTDFLDDKKSTTLFQHLIDRKYFIARQFNTKQWSLLYKSYRFEYLIISIIFIITFCICYFATAPGCPRGYLGPGGLSNNTDHPYCTGGIHRYIDMKFFGFHQIFHKPTCTDIYECIEYDPEGLLGSFNCIILTYIGLLNGRIFLNFKNPQDRVVNLLLASFGLFLLGITLHFSNLIPFNKNLWSISFVFITSSLGNFLLAICYIFIDVLKVWTGAPYYYLGMNSILFYCVHPILHKYMPFSYEITENSHKNLLTMQVVALGCWLIVAWYFYHIRFFVKV